MRTCLRSASLILLALAAGTSPVFATGPRTVTSGGLPIKWGSMPVTVHLESDFDVRGKDITSLIDEALDTWVNLADSDITLTEGSLGAAVNQDNVCTYIFDSSACPSGPTNDGNNPLIIDEDGEITADFFGEAGKFTTLGFASIINFNTSTGAAIKGEAVFNAACLAGVEVTPGCTDAGLSFTDDDFISFIVHELGHFFGLDHSQVNLTEATDEDSSNDSLVTTMFPTFIIGNGANFKTPNRDDEVGVAQLYPSSSFTSGTWKIEGTVFQLDGKTEFQCANVVARNTADPKVDAVSALSGDLAPARTNDGSYEIPGLKSGNSYSLEVVPIDSSSTGSSGYTPCRGTNGEAQPPQFTSFTSSATFTGSAGKKKTVNCTLGGDCVEKTGGGCSLIPAGQD